MKKIFIIIILIILVCCLFLSCSNTTTQNTHIVSEDGFWPWVVENEYIIELDSFFKSVSLKDLLLPKLLETLNNTEEEIILEGSFGILIQCGLESSSWQMPISGKIENTIIIFSKNADEYTLILHIGDKKSHPLKVIRK